ncbi:hypothetical protein C6T68_09900 [Burkholderia multivorans]|nr:hypothetical protein C6T68_09900 [Burkholderia multivorans]
MLMKNDLSPELREYLKQCGFSKRVITKCTLDTRLYHDLEVYGDVAEGCITVLCEQYHVDISGFEFDKYFPPEFVGENPFIRTLLWAVPFLGWTVRRRGKYSALTMRMIDNAIRTGRWQEA